MKGKLFVIEGIDGVGKSTQHSILFDRLKAEGHNVFKVSYPRYEKESSALARMYLSGQFGSEPQDVGAYISATFFACDRYASYKTEYEQLYNDGAIILADRYTTSNMVHQASKLPEGIEREKFLDWIWDFEYRIFGIPIPTQVFFLDIDASTASMLISSRNTDKDIHERSYSHLDSSYKCAIQIAEKYSWDKIQCSNEGELLSINIISDLIYDRLSRYI